MQQKNVITETMGQNISICLDSGSLSHFSPLLFPSAQEEELLSFLPAYCSPAFKNKTVKI